MAQLAALTLLVVTVAAARSEILWRDDAGRQYLAATGWPIHGQAAFALDGGSLRASPAEQPTPIASLAKVMTAYLVLKADPIDPDHALSDQGISIDVTQADVDETRMRRSQHQSVVNIAAGELLTERQALAALLLPSANNVAAILARSVAGSVESFVARMNGTARALGMGHTYYTDPSGFNESTRSTAADQVLLARAAIAVPAFADMVGRSSYQLPVAGTVHNTDTLVGRDGFAGIKTGSMDASEGCFMFLSRRRVAGEAVDVFGVVLGQPGHNLITAALTAARELVDHVAPTSLRCAPMRQRCSDDLGELRPGWCGH